MPSQAPLLREVLIDKEKGDVKAESETEMMWPQAKKCWQSSEAGRAKEVRKGFSCRDFQGSRAMMNLKFISVILIFRFPVSRTLNGELLERLVFVA